MRTNRVEDGCVVDDAQVEWRDNSAQAYCRGEDAECWGEALEHDSGHRNALQAAKVHTLSTGHKTAVESTAHWIVDVTPAGTD